MSDRRLLLLAAALLTGCAAGYVEPDVSPTVAYLTLEPGDMNGATRIVYSAFHDAACTPREGDGAVATVGLGAGPAKTIRVFSGGPIYIRALRQITVANGTLRSCVNLISFVPQPDRQYRLMPETDADRPCELTLIDAHTEKNEASLKRLQPGLACSAP
ncbi:MAG TPA: hypothetical protein VHE37_02845 [Nevskiaceae bacterium]|nr:hypothetical protein [Nevskiaceae bacterium]